MTGRGVHRIADVIGPKNISVQLDKGTDGKTSTWGRVAWEPFHGNRLRAAWCVLTGRAYALQWPTHDELNKAINRIDLMP